MLSSGWNVSATTLFWETPTISSLCSAIILTSSDKILDIIRTSEMIQNVESLRAISIGANSYLVLCSVDYLDSAKDSDIVNINLEIKNKICNEFGEISEIYFNPAWFNIKEWE